MFKDAPHFLQPRLRLFLSADIVGSTALKQSPLGEQKRHEQRTKWFTKIQGFYFEAQKAFSKEFNELKQKLQDPEKIGDPPLLWKTVGDEVLFTKIITDHRQVVQTLHCWMKAVESMRRFIKKDDPRLDIKCSSWIAGFPFRNSEVAVSENSSEKDEFNGDWFLASGKTLEKYYKNPSNSSIYLDFIGPNIDIGFRLSQFCSSRKFIISIDVAYILSIANPKPDIDDRVFNVYFDGSHPLKGVLGGLHYPIFWLDLSPNESLPKFEDVIANVNPVDRDALRKFCSKFFDDHKIYTFPPFIVSDDEPEFITRPEWYDDEHAKLVQSYHSAMSANEDLHKAEETEQSNQVETEVSFDNITKIISLLLKPKDEKGE